MNFKCLFGHNWEFIDCYDYLDTTYIDSGVRSLKDVFRCKRCGKTKIDYHYGVRKYTYKDQTSDYRERLLGIIRIIEFIAKDYSSLLTSDTQAILEQIMLNCYPNKQREEILTYIAKIFGISQIREYNNDNFVFKTNIELKSLVDDVEHKSE